ncbi:MAG: DegV family protein [Erysipelotrichaceae bacterium]|nr:DegV family protein [Erysipelotrichaceae bacterium]
MSIRIITESASDLPNGYRDRVTVLPMSVTFGNEVFLDGVTITPKEFYEKLIEGEEFPTTSLISPGAYTEAFQKALKKDNEILVICISSKLSGCYQSAVLASMEFEGKVTVVDSLNVTLGQQILIDLAVNRIQQGKNMKEIVRELEETKGKIHLLAMLDTLEYLKKGGRISPTVAMVGGVLSIKPVICVEDGEVKVLGKARGSRNAGNYLIREIEKTGIEFSMPVHLGYTGLSDHMLQKYITDSESVWKGNIDHLPISCVGATIGTHIGPNAIAVAFVEEKKKS